MPLVTRSSQNANVRVGTTSQLSALTFTDGDLASDTTLDKIQVYDGSSLIDVATNSFAGAAVVSHSTTLTDYTTPSAATGSSGGGGDLTLSINNNNNANTQQVGGGGGVYNRIGVKFTSGSAYLAKTVDRVSFWLKKTGSPTGTASIVIRNSAGTIKETIGTLDVSTLTGSFAWYDFSSSTSATVLETDDRIEIIFTGGSGGNLVDVGFDTTSQYDTTNTHASVYVSSYTDNTAWDVSFRLYTSVNKLLNIWDNNTATKWTSNSENNPNVYVDMGSALNLCAIAIYWDSTGTETEIKIQSSANATTWTDKRKITASNLTNGAWNYYRFNIAGGARYIRVYGTGTSKTLSIWEIKILKKTDAEILNDLGILEISASDTTLGGNGT